jgi:hypothetical protein
MLATVIDCMKGMLPSNYRHTTNVNVFENNLFSYTAVRWDEAILKSTAEFNLQ